MKEVTLTNDQVLELTNDLYTGFVLKTDDSEKRFFVGILTEDIKESVKRIIKRNLNKLTPIYDTILKEIESIKSEEISEEEKKDKITEFLKEEVEFSFELVKGELVYDFKRKKYDEITLKEYNYELIDKMVE